MYTLEQCRHIVEKRLKEMRLPEKPALLYDPIRYVCGSGGKRIRPALTLLACNLFSDYPENAINPALAIELFHNFTLIHDDIMDGSSLRRGKPTVHKKWDDNVGILSGDAMLIKAYEILSYSPKQILHELFVIFNKTASEVCEGQQYDMDYQASMSVTIQDYLQMIELKTSVLLAASLKIGSLCGGASEKDANLLYSFGKDLGIAFQLQDDLLDVYADQQVFGKSVGSDIIANKKTFLLVSAIKLAKGSLKETLIYWIEKTNFNRTEKIEAILDIYNRLDIKNITREKIRQLFNKAIMSLDMVSVEAERKTVLLDFVSQLKQREK